ncbi:hypothetical protein [Mycobacterium sp. SMC-4]|uniref:hypothetical protein n=1 Tax=Mycobacterium sp. SMC-4 TaxID=2857059 RepID=UPI0021B49021|nr:hypothetical protein [Mycobacterium sp. SMC-4]UXA19816.1 hypothetical protein KXD98_09610 [Mycobacterium sp. SMC-4]
MIHLNVGIAAATTLSTVVAAAVATPANAAVNPALNGVYTATSDGQRSKTNEKFRVMPSVVSRWTMESTCLGAYDCSGTVSSDAGWTADLLYASGMWFVQRTLPGWQHCEDGSTADGRQIIKFHEDPNDTLRYVGWDTTAGPSGACGVNRPVFIEIPFSLVPQ